VVVSSSSAQCPTPDTIFTTLRHRFISCKVYFSILGPVDMDPYNIQPIPEGVQCLRLLFLCPTEGIFCCLANDPNTIDVLEMPVHLEAFYRGTEPTIFRPMVGQRFAALYDGNLCFLFNAVLIRT